MEQSWLIKQVTVAEAEAANMVCNETLGPQPVPFGFCNREWKELLAQMHLNDQLWEYNAPKSEWRNCMGSCGLALIRGGTIVRLQVNAMN